MKVENDVILDILRKYDTIASEVDRLNLCLEINGDDELESLLPKLNFDSETLLGMDIMLTPSDETEEFPCDVTIKVWWISEDPDSYLYEDIIFELCDGEVIVNKFDDTYDVHD